MLRGKLIGERFELGEKLGAGGMGAIYHALDRETGQAVALKLLTQGSSQALLRFAREATLLAELRHPTIVRYLAHGRTDDDVPFLAMEWLQGEDLGQRLSQKSLSLAEILVVIQRTAQALSVGHQRGVIHRDIKPSNLFLVDRSPQQCKLIDFGVAANAQDGLLLTRTGALIGTPAYMSPEQARGVRELTPAVDVFALGAVMFRCLTGRTPFAGDHPAAIFAKLLFDEPPRARSLRPDLSEAIDKLVMRMLARAPEQRPPDGQAVLRELSDLPIDTTLEDSEPTEHIERLTHSEQRWLGIVVVGSMPDLDKTMLLSEIEDTAENIGDVVSGHGGVLHCLADGTRMATVVHTGTATDLAARAARIALAMRRRLPGVAMGLATGRGVLTGSLPVGGTIDNAFRMIVGRSAEDAPLGVWIDDATAGLLGSQFDFETRSNGSLLRDENAEGAGMRRLLGRPTPCVGRERDLTTLESFFRECVEEPVARALLITAEPGGGKTRLAGEFLDRIRRAAEPALVLRGRTDELNAGCSFALLSRALRFFAGIREGEPSAAQRAKLQHHFERDSDELTDTVRFLGELCGIQFPDEDSPALQAARQDPLLMSEQIRAAFSRWLEAECASRPVILLLEDLHWADAPSIKLIDFALATLAERPLFVLALARPEVHTRFPMLWADRSLHIQKLNPLTRKASERLVRAVLGTTISDALVARVVDRAAGNAFFLEELIRMAHSGATADWPETVLGMMQVRLDALDSESKRVLRAASIFGERCWAGAVSALIGDPDHTSTLLEDLCDCEILSRVSPSTLPEEVEYRFRQGLVRDTAYSMLTDSDRALGHRLAGPWLEQAGITDALMLAEHYSRGGPLERAAHFCHRSAQQSLEVNDLTAALERAERALKFESVAQKRGLLRGLQAEAHFWRAELSDSADKAKLAVDAMPLGSVHWFSMMGTLISATGQQGDNDGAERYLQTAIPIAPAADAVAAKVICLCRGVAQLPFAGRHAVAKAALDVANQLLDGGKSTWLHVKGRVCMARAVYLTHTGEDLEQAIRCCEEGMAATAAVGDLRSELLNTLGKANLLDSLGDYVQAEQLLKTMQDRAERARLPMLKYMAGTVTCRTVGRQGRTAEARALMQEMMPFFRASPRAHTGVLIDRSALWHLEGDFARAERDALDAIAAANAPPILATATAALARARVGLGQADEALQDAREATRLHVQIQCVAPTQYDAMIRLALVEALLENGLRDEAAAAIAQARNWIMRLANRVTKPALRESFLTRVRENVRIFELVRALNIP